MSARARGAAAAMATANRIDVSFICAAPEAGRVREGPALDRELATGCTRSEDGSIPPETTDARRACGPPGKRPAETGPSFPTKGALPGATTASTALHWRRTETRSQS